MGEVVSSLRADELVKKAQLCFELGLLSEEKFKRITDACYSDPDYNGWDMPFDWDIEAEQKRRAELARQTRRARRLLRLRRLVHR